MKHIVLAADLGGTNLRMAAIDNAGEILFRVKRETPQNSGAREILEALVNAAENCRENLENTEILAVAAAVPAIISHDGGLIFKSPNLPGLDGFPIVEELEKKLGVKAILENDANAAAVGENWLGSSKNIENSITVTLGTGIGGGLIINGKILHGADGTAGEIGHICVEPFGHKCGCGSRGCVEQYASASALVRQAEELSKDFPTSELPENKSLTSEDIYNYAKKDDKLALEIFRRQGFYLGIMLGSLINVLNPEMIVIGGGASAGWDLFLPTMEKEIYARSYKEPAARAKIVRATLGDDAGILGAAKVAFNKYNR